MSNNNATNDTKIMDLKTQIAKKREQLEGVKKFSPITNCSIEFEGVRSNIQTLGRIQLIEMCVKLNSLQMSAKDLGLLDEYLISGYKVESWITDIKSRLEGLSRKGEELKLKMMEDKLDELLSNEKRTELELDEIGKLLK